MAKHNVRTCAQVLGSLGGKATAKKRKAKKKPAKKVPRKKSAVKRKTRTKKQGSLF